MFIYVVKQGDNIYEIARKYGVPMDRIVEDNQIDDPRELVVGQSLIIRKDDFVYTVRPNDTIYKLSERFQVPIEVILEANNLTSNSSLNVGQQLNIVYSNPNKVPMEINGYAYPEIDINVLRRALPYLTYLAIFSYQVKSDGTLNEIQDEQLIREAYQQNVAPLMVVANIDQPGQFSGELMHTIFTNPNLENTLINNIISRLKQKGYYGVDFDFEYLLPEDKELYNRFLEKATTRLHAQGFKVSTAIAPKLNRDQPGQLYEAHDYQAHGKTVDHIVIMTYEWGYIWSEAMPVAPINMVERVIEYAVTEIPSKKILMGMPNYGYDFNVPRIENVPATLITNPEAIDIARRENASIKYNEEAQSPFFNYYDNNRKQHEVHFEDARSIAEKIQLAIDYNLGGLSYWTIMSFFNQNWLLVDYYLDVVKVIGR